MYIIFQHIDLNKLVVLDSCFHKVTNAVKYASMISFLNIDNQNLPFIRLKH